MAAPAGEEAEEPPPDGEPDLGPDEEEEGEKEEAPPAPEHDDAVPDEWPVSAKARVKEEAEKRRRATKERTAIAAERDQWRQTAEQLHGRLQQAAVQQGAPLATPEDPLADVVDGQGLLKARQQFWEMLEFAEKHPDGVDDYLLGKNAKGEEIRMDYTRDDIAKMKLTSMQVLAEGIGAKAQYLQEVDRHAHIAKELLPELFSEEPNEANQIAAQFLQKMPAEIRTKVKEWPLVLAYAVAGKMQLDQKSNGAASGAPARTAGGKPLSKAAQAILGAPKVPVAPGMPRTRAVDAVGRQGPRVVDVEKAKQAHIDSGFSSETLERLIAIKRAGTQQTGSKSPALV
jgi:gas vesicle protein